ncbi:MAG: putative toxin-antitoxin system toxin component, PIN family [Mycoplasmataceae bacterium]|jgi:putative PIN family toxin of toxin-antitoxin system|nr:putative toxin-antitoxin system toxin component, PIN family [Mycoplasmataceae bacterium]
MKILLDTNILISTFALHSTSIKNLLDLCIEKGHKLFIDDYCMNELNDVLTKKFFDIQKNVSTINSIMDLPSVSFVFTDPSKKCSRNVRDAKDERVISSALANQMDVLLTGDKDLLTLKNAKIPILNPASLMNVI